MVVLEGGNNNNPRAAAREMRRPTDHCSDTSRLGPVEGSEWPSEGCAQSIVIGGIEIKLCAYGVELSLLFSICADKIADEGIRGLSGVTYLMQMTNRGNYAHGRSPPK